MQPPPSRPTLRPVGHVVAGKYELKHVLGSGSMGEVWVARHRTLNADVALKLLKRSSWGYDAEDLSVAAARLRFEAQVAARLSRKTRHIVRVTDHGEEGGLAYIVMELLSGQTLESWLLHYASMRLEDVPRVVTQIARALEQAHAEGVVHRDLKPGNIFLTRDEDGGLLAKVLDFGIARSIGARAAAPAFATAPGLLFGTPGYMSPEQVLLSPKVNHYCDLWALATVAYELLTGELPVRGAHPGELIQNLREGRLIPVKELMPDLPAAVEAFFRKAFAPRLEDRYESAPQLAAAFQLAAGGHDAIDEGVRARIAGSGGRGTTVRMPTLLMEIQPWVASKRSWPRRMLGARRGFVAAFVLLGLPGSAVAWRLSQASPASASGTPPATVEPVIADNPPAVTLQSTLADQASAVHVPPPSSAPAITSPVRSEHRFGPVPAPGKDATAAASGKPDCKLPYTLDPGGKKRWKLECL